MAGSHFAKSGFHLQLAGWVLVGNPCGDPGPTALGTWAPLGALLSAGGGWLDQFVQWMIPVERWPQPGGPHGWKTRRNHESMKTIPISLEFMRHCAWFSQSELIHLSKTLLFLLFDPASTYKNVQSKPQSTFSTPKLTCNCHNKLLIFGNDSTVFLLQNKIFTWSSRLVTTL